MCCDGNLLSDRERGPLFSPGTRLAVDPAIPPTWQQLSEALRRYAQAEYGVDVSAVTFHLAYLGDAKKPLALPARAAIAAATPAPAPLPAPAAAVPSAPPEGRAAGRPAGEQYPWEPWHSETFEMVAWEGQKFEFGPKARLIVARLWQAWEANR